MVTIWVTTFSTVEHFELVEQSCSELAANSVRGDYSLDFNVR